MSDEILNAALQYAAAGLKVFPVGRNKQPFFPWKDNATTDEKTIREWWARYPDANVAYLTGKYAENLFLTVIDLDTHNEAKNGIAELEKWLQENKFNFPETLTATTGGGGKHLYFFTDKPGKSAANYLPGVDVRSKGGYVVAPPSVHESGSLYKWDKPFSVSAIARGGVEVEALLSEKEKSKSFKTDYSKGAGGSVEGIINHLGLDFTEGSRNNSLYRLACSLQARGRSDSDIYSTVMAVNKERCKPPLPEKEVETIVGSSLEEPKGKPAGGVNAAGANCAMSQRDEMPYYIYMDGKCNYKVIPSLLAKYIREHENILISAGAKPRIYIYKDPPGIYKEYDSNAVKALIQSYIAKFSEGIIKRKDVDDTYSLLTAREEKLDENDLNADESVINCENGLLRLKDLQLLPHSPELLSTIQLPLKWSGKPAPTPEWDKFLGNLLPEEEEREFLLEFMGIAFSNLNGGELKKALFLRGKPNCGKSVLFNLIAKLIGGDNTCSIQLQELEKNTHAVPALFGKRLAGSPEAKIKGLCEMDIFKSVTGGDLLYANPKNQTPFNFVYRGIVLFCCNNMPAFEGEKNEAVYSRVAILDCPYSVPAEKQDKNLLSKLYQEREGIFFQAVAALKRFIERGKKIIEPESVRVNRARLEEDNSPVREFFYSNCVCIEPGAERTSYTTRREIFNTFLGWCEKCNIDRRGYTLQRFGAEIAEICGVSRAENEITARDGKGHFVRLYSYVDLRPDYYEIQKAI